MHNKVTGQTRTGFTEIYAQSLIADCDLDLWPSHKTGFTEIYAQSLSAECDLDLWPSDMVLVCSTCTSSCPNDHLCQIIFKSHNA